MPEKIRARLTTKERILLLTNLSKLLGSGVALRDALGALKDEVSRKGFVTILSHIITDVEEGSPLHQSFATYHVLDNHGLSLLRVGEQSGQLVQNLRVLTEQQEKARAFNQKIRSALTYPAFVLGLTVGVGILITWFVLPRITSIFSSLQGGLPIATKWLINLGELLRTKGIYIIPSVIIILGLLLFFLFGYKKTKHVGQAILLRLPGFRTLVRKVELARFGYLLGTLLDAGIPITDAFTSLAESTKMKRYQEYYKKIGKQVENGLGFQKIFRDNPKLEKLISRTNQQMIIAALQSGRLSSTLIEISEQAERETENALKNITVLLEPILLVIVWLGVVGVALAVILPIYQLVSSIN